jgi:hypothetical protein
MFVNRPTAERIKRQTQTKPATKTNKAREVVAPLVEQLDFGAALTTLGTRPQARCTLHAVCAEGIDDWGTPIAGIGFRDHPSKRQEGRTVPLLYRRLAAASGVTPWRDGAKHLHSDHDNIMIKPEQGTSRSYTLDRLQRQHPDLVANP